MTFTTPTFLIFLVAMFATYWQFDRRGQNLIILAGSIVFYGWWDWRFLGLLLVSAGVDFEVARALARTTDPSRRRLLLAVSLVTNLGILGFFKYFDFFIASFEHGLRALGVHATSYSLRVILPLGISFYTFQALSYTIDVYRRQIDAVDDPVQYFCFITFFPHMVAGPIQRAVHLLTQFGEDRRFDDNTAADGARQMLWGFFKKMVVADALAPIVSAAYSNAATASGSDLLWASYAFAFQIYCDFSGYTDIAIGCAKLFGFRLTRNFAYPYFSRGITDFWRRWHISLSTWFREYLYIPLGGNRVARWRRKLNVFIVFVVSGFWHGANWTFVVWGAMHGIYYLVEPLLGLRAPSRDLSGDHAQFSFNDLLRIFITFQLVCVAWIFFRADTISRAFTILGRIGHAVATGRIVAPPVRWPFAGAAILLLVEWLQRRAPHGLALEGWSRPVRWAAYYVVVAALLLFAQLGFTPFIYFQF